MSIPIVIFHIGGNQLYFKKCVENSSKNNIVYLIGDDSNKTTFSSNPNVQFFNVNEFNSNNVIEFKKCFVNYSSNNHERELYCFLRVFYLKEFFEKTGKKWVFHTDSDCVVLENINNIFKEPTCNAYSIQKLQNKYHMVGSIHNALINIDFCNKFIELCFDVYKNRSKFNLINEKMEWHKKNKIQGGICDMTLYFLLYSENLINNIIDLNMPILINGENVVFDHNISDSYGYNGENTFEKNNSGNKRLIKKDNSYYFKTNDGVWIKTISVHFQGKSKMMLERFSL